MNDLRCYVEFTFCKLGGAALIEALGRSDLAAVEVLLYGVKDADSLTGGPFAVRLMNLLSIWTDDTFLRAVVLLHKHGMDLEPPDKALLPFVAGECKVRLVKRLLELGASPKAQFSGSSASSEASWCPEPEKEAIQSEIFVASAVVGAGGTRPSKLELRPPCGVQNAKWVNYEAGECICRTELFGAGCPQTFHEYKFSEADIDPRKDCPGLGGRCLGPEEFKRLCEGMQGSIGEMLGDCQCSDDDGRRNLSREKLNNIKNAYGHIHNHALKFCSGLYAEVWRTAARSVRGMIPEILSALGHQEAQKICQTALDGQVTPKEADEELLYPEKHPVRDPPPGENTRLYKVLDGKEQSIQSWKQLLKDVCKDECHDLVTQMRDYEIARELAMAADSSSLSVSEACAELVVQKVEAEVLTCCAEECGWDEQQCQLWPFMDASQQSSWKARCCEEGNILKGSSRESLCNSVEPSSVREELEKIDTVTETPGDDVRVGMSIKEGTAFFQAVSVAPACNMATGVRLCRNPESHKVFLKLCEKPGEGWQFLESGQHSTLKRHAVPLKGTGVSACKEQLKEKGVDSVSWLGKDDIGKGTDCYCYVIKTPKESKEHEHEVRTAYKAVQDSVTGLKGGVPGAALFMKR
ncbi:unnamed protein product [Symbiodinium necroappetens]|uniref:Uncharacterized protein n=1 Tax=Symbiodinium necroappetens TaxID=1628268 RepID=A0A812J9G0_9DINO|nr:unnamed protein product [Symbiodinium necroappetens]